MIDITEAVDAAARAVYEQQRPEHSWDDLEPVLRHNYLEAVLPAVTAAAAVIEAAVLATVAPRE